MLSDLKQSVLILSLGLLLAISAAAQSSDVNFPTYVTSNEIVGTVKARDIGDARLTSYYYVFDGEQGDIFINVVTRNFSGDIDVFNAEGLLPLTKMVIYASGDVNETGRLIYLRKSERLILRLQGRSPNDDPATFRIKFGGSFVAMSGKNTDNAPKIASKGEVNESGVRVNSVGTIIEVIPKPQPIRKPEETTAVTRPPVKPKAGQPEPSPSPQPAETVAKTEPKDEAEEDDDAADPGRTITTAPEVKTVFGKPSKTKPKRRAAAGKPASKPPTTAAAKSAAKPAKTQPDAGAPPTEANADPLASIHLVVQMKDGTTVERPMNEVTKFSVDKGVLTVIQKNGITLRISIFDVDKVTIE